MSAPNKVSRRGFLGLFREESPDTSAAQAPAQTPTAQPAEGFSLKAFYAARVPATELHVTLSPNLPRVATTRVGVPDLVTPLGPPAPSCPDAERVCAEYDRSRKGDA